MNVLFAMWRTGWRPCYWCLGVWVIVLVLIDRLLWIGLHL